ncbi:MAG: zinc ribbon domain-containing protein [Fimbriimonadaceae bacterium]
MTYKCPKCACAMFKLGELYGSAGAMSALFNVDSAVYTAVICAKCDFTEFYTGYAEDFQRRHRLGSGPIHGFGEGLES